MCRRLDELTAEKARCASLQAEVADARAALEAQHAHFTNEVQSLREQALLGVADVADAAGNALAAPDAAQEGGDDATNTAERDSNAAGGEEGSVGALRMAVREWLQGRQAALEQVAAFEADLAELQAAVRSVLISFCYTMLCDLCRLQNRNNLACMPTAV